MAGAIGGRMALGTYTGNGGAGGEGDGGVKGGMCGGCAITTPLESTAKEGIDACPRRSLRVFVPEEEQRWKRSRKRTQAAGSWR